jgi:hypothetical protein
LKLKPWEYYRLNYGQFLEMQAAHEYAKQCDLSYQRQFAFIQVLPHVKKNSLKPEHILPLPLLDNPSGGGTFSPEWTAAQLEYANKLKQRRNGGGI